MPRNNCFKHQTYKADSPQTVWTLLEAASTTELTDTTGDSRLLASGAEVRRAGVRRVYLVHGTFAGDDALGMIRSLARVMPQAASKLLQLHKDVFDRLAEDAGNYTEAFADSLAQGWGIPVSRFFWSSENHHLARADAAVQLLDQLAATGLPSDERILLWGHSHAGNVFALMTNLLGSEKKVLRRFFHAARSYYRSEHVSPQIRSAWKRVRDRLIGEAHEPRLPKLCFVTFGTPIRYGWDTGGYDRLLHFVHHRPRPELPGYLTALPRSLDDVMAAIDGDYIQQWGIAGTNLTPNVFSWGSWIADIRLGRLIQAGQRRLDLLTHLQTGQRVPDEGETLLVDYGPISGNVAQHIAGHAVYTRRRWLAFHAGEIARRLFG